MPSLILSRRDVDFLLYEWLDVTSLTSRPRFADHSRETFDSALETFESIATERFAPHRKKNDQQEPSFDGERVILNPEVGEAVRAYSEAGLVAATHDYDLGGMQLPEAVASAGMAFMYAANVGTSGYPLLTVGNANLLIAHGGPALVDKYVRPMLAGRFFGTMCLSEPQAGSSLADITTRAELQADGRYRLFGNKMWISAADHEMSENIIHLVLAKIPAPDGSLPHGVQGISLFVVPRRLVDAEGRCGERNDVNVAGVNHKMGYRGTINCALNFGEGRFRPEGTPGAIGEIVGEPGKGLAYMFHMMNEARIGVGLSAAALGNTGYLHAVDYARQRRQGRPLSSRDPSQPQVPIIEHADVRRMLLAQKAWVEGGLALSLFCSRIVDDEVTGADEHVRAEASLLLDLLTPIAKSWPSQWCTAANDLAIQVHGGYGYSREYNVEQFYRDNRLNAIHEGTHGIQALDLLGRKVRLQNGAALKIVNARVAATIARSRGIPALVPQADKLAAAWGRVMEVTMRLQGVADPALRLANATPYLEAFGHVFVGWLWLDMACAAAKALPAASGEAADFYRGKLQASAYFMNWELPRVEAWLAVLDPVDATCLEMQPDWF